MYECFKYLAEEINSDVSGVCGSRGLKFAYKFRFSLCVVGCSDRGVTPDCSIVQFSDGALDLIRMEMNRVEQHLANGKMYSSELMRRVAGRSSEYICRYAAALFIKHFNGDGEINEDCAVQAIAYFRSKVEKYQKQQRKEGNAELYLMQNGDFLKVGISDNPTRRIKDMQTGNPIEITLLQSKVFGSRFKAEQAESRLHNKLKSLRLHVRGEWFNKCDEVFKEFSKVRSVK